MTFTHRVKRRSCVSRLAPLGALLLAACSTVSHRPEVANRVDDVDEARLRDHVAALVQIGPRSGHDAAETEATVRYLEESLRKLGYEPRRETFTADIRVMTQRVNEDGSISFLIAAGEPQPRHNVIVEIPGRTAPESVVEVGAHYDTVRASPGADDNASGVAALLEAARVLRGAEPAATIRFIFFALEEDDFQGSRAHVAALGEAERASFRGMIGLDMVGVSTDAPDSQETPVWVPFLSWGSVGDFLLVLGNNSSGDLGNRVEDAIDVYVPELPYYSLNRIGGWFDDGYRSDHVPYWEAGLRAIELTDTGELRTPHYHAPSDLPTQIDFEFLSRVTQATAAAALHRANE